jgi:hypothetical protein
MAVESQLDEPYLMDKAEEFLRIIPKFADVPPNTPKADEAGM